MSKAEETREKILRQAAELFNQQGYAGSSMSDLMKATGLQKGGIYNHFESKQALALEAFDFAFKRASEYFLTALRGKRHAPDRLKVILLVFQRFLDEPPLPGGCPLMNMAIESDDANPLLRKRVQQAMTSWRNMICRIVEKGVANGEFQPDIEADTVASIVICTLEGAVMMSKLYGDRIHMERAIEHLTGYIDCALSTEKS